MDFKQLPRTFGVSSHAEEKTLIFAIITTRRCKTVVVVKKHWPHVGGAGIQSRSICAGTFTGSRSVRKDFLWCARKFEWWRTS